MINYQLWLWFCTLLYITCMREEFDTKENSLSCHAIHVLLLSETLQLILCNMGFIQGRSDRLTQQRDLISTQATTQSTSLCRKFTCMLQLFQHIKLFHSNGLGVYCLMWSFWCYVGCGFNNVSYRWQRNQTSFKIYHIYRKAYSFMFFISNAHFTWLPRVSLWKADY